MKLGRYREKMGVFFLDALRVSIQGTKDAAAVYTGSDVHLGVTTLINRDHNTPPKTPPS